MYAAALRGAGFRVTVRGIGGLRPATVRAMRRGRIDMWPGYAGSLRGYLGGRSPKRRCSRIGAQPLKRSPAQDRNGFAMKRDVARGLGVSKLSDLARYWPPHRQRRRRGAAASEARSRRAVGGRPGSVLDLPGAWDLPRAPA